MMRGRGRGRGRGRFIPIQQQKPAMMPRDNKPANNNRDSLYCSYCKVELSSKKLYNDHIQSAVHKQKEILIGKALSDGLHFCYSCEKIFPSKIELDAHCLMTRHQPLYRVEEFHNTNDESLMPVKRPPEPETKERSKGIVMDLNKLRNDNREGASNENKFNKPFYCGLCDVDCLNNGNYKMHVESWRHRAEVDKIRDEKMQREQERALREAEERMKTPSHMMDKSHYFCEVCSAAMKIEKEYFEHLRSRKHLRQIAALRRPFKCYICNMETSVEKDFNYHLESKSHMMKAFKSVESPIKGRKDDEWRESRGRKDDEWVEKKKLSTENNTQNDRRHDLSKDRRNDSNERQVNRQFRRDEIDPKSQSNIDDRKVEIVKTPINDGPVADLREKLKSQKIVITKPNDQDKRDAKQPIEKEQNKQKPVSNENEGQTDLDKRAKEMEFEAKFRKLEREFSNDGAGFQARLKADREEDISKYQHFEAAYNRLCREEDFIREDLRVLKEGDPRKEEFIRDMIKVQEEMREVRQELEIREMMIIKRETLFREKFPENQDKQVVVNQENDYTTQQQQIANEDKRSPEKLPPPKEEANNQNDDLRIQLERERLLKRLGPELEGIDPSMKEKLLAAIFDKETPQKPVVEGAIKKETIKERDPKREDQMKYLTEREKQLEKELADLKSSASQKKKFTTSLVPQYDDVDDKKDKKKPRGRNRSVSRSSSSSSSGSDSSSDSRSRKKERKRRRGSPSSSKSRSKSKRSSSPERRKKRHRSSSRDRDKRKKRREEKRSKSDRSKSDRKSKSSRDKDEKGNPKAISVIGGNSSSVAQPEPEKPVLSRYQQVLQDQQRQAQLSNPQQPPSDFNNYQRRESSAFWKNPVSAAQNTQPARDSPKEDVWDIAFSGGNVKNTEKEETLDIFNTEQAPVATFSQDIINILRNVAPAIQQGNLVDRRGYPPQPINDPTNVNRDNVYGRVIPSEARQSPRSFAGQPTDPLTSQPTGRPTQTPERPPFNATRKDFQAKDSEYNRFNEPDNSKLFPVRIPEETPAQNKSFTTSTPLPGTGAGGRVRSILKKMKNAPAPIEEDTSFSQSSASEPSQPNAIPGLDTLGDKERPERKEEMPMNKSYQQNFNTEVSYQRHREERELYGDRRELPDRNPKDFGNYRDYGSDVPNERYPQESRYQDKAPPPTRYDRGLANLQEMKPRDEEENTSMPPYGGRRYPPPVDLRSQMERKPSDINSRRNVDIPPKKDVAEPNKELEPNRKIDDEIRRPTDFNRNQENTDRQQDAPLDLFPPVRMENESNSSYDERYRIYLELKRRKEDEERRKIADVRPQATGSPHPKPFGERTVVRAEDDFYRRDRRQDERLTPSDYRGPPPARTYDRPPPILRGEDFSRDIPRSSYGGGGDIRRVQDERVRGNDGNDQVRRVEDSSPFVEERLRERRPYEGRVSDPIIQRHDRDTFFRREVPTYRDDPYRDYPPRSQPPMHHDQRRPIRHVDEPHDYRRPVRPGDEIPPPRHYRDRSPPPRDYGRPVERESFSYQHY